MQPDKVASAVIPVHILTGFLGSGKTTLLKHLLTEPDYADTAVIVNEFGEVGIDDALIQEVADDVILLASGCLCCTAGDDLPSTLMNLRRRADADDIPAFRRVVIETSGLAEPGAILRTVLSSSVATESFRAGSVITVVDAVAGLSNLRSQSISLDQAALADRLVVTKTDIVGPGVAEALVERLQAINPGSTILLSHPEHMPRCAQLLVDKAVLPKDPKQLYFRPARSHAHHHDERISSFVIERNPPVVWESFTEWLDLLLSARGDQILRIKGVIAVQGRPGPILIQTVQHLVFAPETLPAWPWEEGKTMLVVIARDMTSAGLEKSFRDL